jgi:hypothetical protein
MNISYLIYSVERPRSIAEQREADMRTGEFAATVAHFGHSLRHPAMGKRVARRGGQRRASTTVACASPRPR